MNQGNRLPPWQHGAGWVLIALAPVVLLGAGAVGQLTWAAALNNLDEVLVATLGAVAIVRLLNFWFSEPLQVRARAGVGVLLCSAVISLVPTAQRNHVEQVYAEQSNTIRARYAHKLEEWVQRHAKWSLDRQNTFVLEKFGSDTGIAEARLVVAQFRALVAERSALVQSFIAEHEELAGSIQPEGMRGMVRERMVQRMAPTMRAFSELDRAQARSADAMTAILDWVAAHKGSVEVRDGRFLVAGVQQQQQLNALSDDLAKVLAAESAAINAVNRLRSGDVENS